MQSCSLMACHILTTPHITSTYIASRGKSRRLHRLFSGKFVFHTWPQRVRTRRQYDTRFWKERSECVASCERLLHLRIYRRGSDRARARRWASCCFTQSFDSLCSDERQQGITDHVSTRTNYKFSRCSFPSTFRPSCCFWSTVIVLLKECVSGYEV